MNEPTRDNHWLPYSGAAMPAMTGDTEKDHATEDAALWGFVAYVFGFCGGDNERDYHLRAASKAFLDWDIKNSDRIRGYD